MALHRLHLRKVRRNKPVRASARLRRLFRRAGDDWKYTDLRPLRSKTWIITPRRDNSKLGKALREFFRITDKDMEQMGKDFDKGADALCWNPTMKDTDGRVQITSP